jgi:hypothetical protein
MNNGNNESDKSSTQFTKISQVPKILILKAI